VSAAKILGLAFNRSGHYGWSLYNVAHQGGHTMNTFNFAPLMHTSVGFDRFERLFEQAFNGPGINDGFPHYDIQKIDENQYRITLAVAGYSKDDVEITQKQNQLVVKGTLKKDDGNYLHRGIAARKFERQFHLADYVEVVNASIENGLLVVDLAREIPEALKPRKIEILGENLLMETTKDKIAA